MTSNTDARAHRMERTMRMSAITRRGFLFSGAAFGVGLLAACTSPEPQQVPRSATSDPAESERFGVGTYNTQEVADELVWIGQNVRLLEDGQPRKRILITGSTAGLGQLATAYLLARGHSVVAHARNAQREADVRRDLPALDEVVVGDLSDLDQTRALAQRINETGPFDVIVHNAGEWALPGAGILTVNSLSPYLMTSLVEVPAHSIYLSSAMHLSGSHKPDEVASVGSGVMYSDSKLQILMLALAAGRLRPGARFSAVDPGWIPTRMGYESGGGPDPIRNGYMTQVWLAEGTDPGSEASGSFFHHEAPTPPARENEIARDEAAQDELMAAYHEATGQDFPAAETSRGPLATPIITRRTTRNRMSKKKTSLAAIATGLALTLTAVGCSGQTESEPQSTNSTPEAPATPETTEPATPASGELATATYDLDGVRFTMIVVEGGTFTMGDDERAAEGGTQVANQAGEHEVTLSSYTIGETEVTQALWDQVMNGSFDEGDAQYPVASITVPDSREFIERLNEQAHAAGIIPDDRNFHMLTEAQWEFAAKGGKDTQGFRYAGSDDLTEVGWTSDDGPSVHPIKQKKPNELGLYDMSGNVYEWVADYAAPYPSQAQTDPLNDTPSDNYIKRGGSFYYNDEYRFTTTYRYFYSATDHTIGLRIGLS